MLGHAVARLPALAAEARSLSDAWTFHVIPHAICRTPPRPTPIFAATDAAPPSPEAMATTPTHSGSAEEEMSDADDAQDDAQA
jgi:hypothetical protein